MAWFKVLSRSCNCVKQNRAIRYDHSIILVKSRRLTRRAVEHAVTPSTSSPTFESGPCADMHPLDPCPCPIFFLRLEYECSCPISEVSRHQYRTEQILWSRERSARSRKSKQTCERLFRIAHIGNCFLTQGQGKSATQDSHRPIVRFPVASNRLADVQLTQVKIIQGGLSSPICAVSESTCHLSTVTHHRGRQCA